MSFLKNLLAAIGSIFSGLVSAAKKTYNKLPKETQDALVHGSGVIDLINSMLSEAPGAVREAIQKKYPDLDIKKLEGVLFTIAETLNLLPSGKDLDYLISVIQTYLKGLKGKFWADASRSLSSLIAAFLSPAETKYEAIASLIGTVYHWLVKKK